MKLAFHVEEYQKHKKFLKFYKAAVLIYELNNFRNNKSESFFLI